MEAYIDKILIAVAGFVGGIVSLAYIKNLSLKSSVLAILVGMASAYYFTLPLMHIFNLTQFHEPIAFMVGMFGMTVIGFLFEHSDKIMNKITSMFIGK